MTDDGQRRMKGILLKVTGQLADMPTRGLDKSRTRQVADGAGSSTCSFSFNYMIMRTQNNATNH